MANAGNGFTSAMICRSRIHQQKDSFVCPVEKTDIRLKAWAL